MTSLDVASTSGGASGASAPSPSPSSASPSVRPRGPSSSSSSSPSPWLSAPLSSASRGVSGSPQAGVAYDRRRLRELVATSNAQPSVALAQSYLQLQSSSGRSASLYSSALLQLAAELAKMKNVPWEKVARMCALCPPLPSPAAHPQLAASWKEITAAFNAQIDGQYDDDEDDEDEEEEESESTSKNNNEESRSSSLPPHPAVQWEYSPARLAVVESGSGGGGGEALDSRVDGLWSLARYLILASAAGETAAASHLGRLLPVLLRFLLSLPFCTYDALNFPQVAPRPVAHTAVNLLAELAKNVRESRKLAATAVLILLRQCADAVLADANKAAQIAKAAAAGGPQPQQPLSFASSSAQYLPVLEGVLAALGDHPFPLGENAASSMGDELHKLFLAKYLLPASLYGLLLRATTTLLAAHPDAYAPDRLKYLFEHEFMRVGFTYSQAPLLVGASAPASVGSVSPGLPRRPSIGGGGAGGAGGVASATSVAEAAQALILVQTINLGVLVGLIATSRPGLRGEQPNCTGAEEERIKEQSLHKLKQLLDQILNVQLVEPAPAPAQSAAVANALMSPMVGAAKGLPHVGSASSASSTIAIPLVVIGCVDASRAILNGVMELANKYASDGASIPNIVEAIRSILLGSRRLSRHPKEKQLRYYLTISLSKVFKLELQQLQGHTTLATSLVRSVSTQDMQAAGSAAAAAAVGGRSRASSNVDVVESAGAGNRGDSNETLSIPSLRMVRSSSSHALNNHSGGIAAAYGHFSNSFTRSFVQSLQAQLYKDDIAAQSVASAPASAADGAASAKSLQLYQRILVLLLDLVSLIDFAPLTLLVMPGMIARLTARPYFLHLVIQQLTDVALMEERRYAAKQSAAAAATLHASVKSAPPASVTAGPLSADLKMFDSVINLFMQAYAARPLNESDGGVAASGAPSASAAAASSRKSAIELPAALLRIATELRAPQLKRHLLRRILRLTLDLAAEVRSDELAMAQALAEIEKAKRQKKKQPEPAAAAAALNISGVNRTEACGFLLPVLAVLIRDCYAEQAASPSPSSSASSQRAQQVGLQLFSNPDSNVKWFRRLWFFLVSFHFTDALVSSSGSAGGAGAASASGSGGAAGGSGSGGSVGVGDTWSESIRSIALYSPLLINTASFADVLSVELAKEYELAFRRVDRAGSTALLAATGSASNAASSADSLSSAAVDKITAKLHAALADGYRKQLTALFPQALSWDISQLSMGRVLFLLTLVHLETIRIKACCGAVASLNTAGASPSAAKLPASVAALQAARRSLGGGALHVLFAYLGHYPLSRMDLTKFVSSFGELSAFPLVGRLVFKEDGSAGIGSGASAPARRAEMESAIQFLLRTLAGRVEIQRRTALHFLHNLTRAHVHLQWSSNCLATLLELLQVVQESLDTNVALQSQSPSSSFSFGARGPTGVNEFAQLKQTLDMPDDLVQRREVHKTLQQLARSWLDSAKAHVPEQTALVVQEFVQRVQRNLSRHTNRESWHTSLHLLLQSSQLGSPSAGASSGSASADPMSSWGLDSLPGIIGGLNIRERYLGEIKGLYRSYHESADRKRRDWAVARAKREAHATAAAAAAHAHAHPQANRAGGAASEDHLRPPLHSGTRSMSVLIQDEQAEAFQRLLHRRAHRHGNATPHHSHDSIDSTASVSVSGTAKSDNGPQIPPFGRLLTAKLIAEGNEILHSFHSIHASAPQAESGLGAGASASAAAQDAQAQRARSEREREENLAQLHRRFERLLCLTAALLIWSTHARRAAVCSGSGSATAADPDLDVDAQDLLHLVVKAPSQIFTPEAMETSVVVWEWILGSNSAFQLPLMVEMKAAWGYTVDRQVGLFSHRRQAKTKEAKSEEKKLPLAQQAQAPQQQQAHGARPTSPVSSNAYSVPSQGGNLDPSAPLNSPRPPLSHKNSSDPTLLPNANDPAVVVAPGDDGVVRTGDAPNLVHPPAVLASGSGAAAGGDAAVALDAAGLPLGSSTGAGAGTAAGGGAGSHHDLVGSDLIHVCQSHLIWINFLLSHFKYLRSFSRDVINILAGMLHKSFARVDLLSSSEQSFGCRLRLLHLGLQLVQGGSDGGAPLLDLRDQQLLRDRIYQAALHWFHAQPCWYDPGTPRQLRDDVQIVLDFCAALQREDQHWAEPRDVQEVVEDLSYPLATPAAKAKATAPNTATAASTATAKSRVAELQKQRNLLVFLLSHELDRIHTWHAPLGGATDALPPSGSFTTRRSMYAPEWRTLIGTAWSLSPKLCVRLCQRFQQNAIVLGEITKLVQAHPSLVYDLPEAVVFLVTEEVLKRAAAAAQDASGTSASVLRHLIYWTPATLPVAIWFLCAPFCHNRLVLEYAVHTLRSHPPESVMFYLSQIIQCLRNDSDDQLLYKFLLESSKASVLLSHQLLWLAQAELGEVKATTKYVQTPFRQLIERLIADVIRHFDSVERRFFQQEFEFFEQITAISGILKPIPTKQGRKDKIKEQLQLIQKTTPNIYLPTNPQLQVVDIICTSGAPMQSAAKVPILVAFKVRVGDLDLSAERAAQQARRLRSIACAQAESSRMLLQQDSRPMLLEPNEERKSADDAVAADLPSVDAEAAADGDDEMPPVAIHIDGETSSRSSRNQLNGDAGGAAPGGGESSHLDPEEIDLMAANDPELSLTPSVQHLNTSVAKENAAKLAAAKSTADAEGVLVQACIFKVRWGRALTGMAMAHFISFFRRDVAHS